jgi:peptide/nickel transport system substrate-binding protein
VYWLGLNAGLLPLELRQAISLALDRPALLEGLLPAARPALGLLPPDLPGAVGEGDPLAASFPRRDLARARALVAASGHDGRTLTLLVRASGTFLPEVAIADGVRRQLADIGLTVKLVATADFANDIKDPTGRVRHPLFLRRIGADYAHPQTFFTPFAPTGLNYTGFEQLEGGALIRRFQALVERGAAEAHPEDAVADFTAAQAVLLVDAAVAVPLYYPDRYSLTRSWLQGLGVDAFNFLTLRDARVRGDAR